MKLRHLLVLLSLSLFVFSGLVGCASFAPHTQMPASGKHIAIQVLESEPGMNDYPIGAYTIPNSQVVITKPRKISMLEGGFGLLGVMSAHSSGKKASKEVIGDFEDVLGVSLKPYLENAVRSATAETGLEKFFLADRTDGPKERIDLVPFTYLAPDENGNGSLFMFMKARYYDVKGTKGWSSRYIYQHDEDRPIKGDDSWTSENGRLFQEALQQGYRNLVGVMIKDSDRNAAGWGVEPAIIKSSFFVSEPFELKGEILEKSNDTVIFNAAGGGIVYGINVLPLDSVEILPPKKSNQ